MADCQYCSHGFSNPKMRAKSSSPASSLGDFDHSILLFPAPVDDLERDTATHHQSGATGPEPCPIRPCAWGRCLRNRGRAMQGREYAE